VTDQKLGIIYGSLKPHSGHSGGMPFYDSVAAGHLKNGLVKRVTIEYREGGGLEFRGMIPLKLFSDD